MNRRKLRELKDRRQFSLLKILLMFKRSIRIRYGSIVQAPVTLGMNLRQKISECAKFR